MKMKIDFEIYFSACDKIIFYNGQISLPEFDAIYFTAGSTIACFLFNHETHPNP